MNTINLGQNCLGVQSAAKRYFNKDVSELTLSECAVIAGITQNPTRYDPVTHPEENAKRRDIVLNNMLEQGYITQQEFDEPRQTLSMTGFSLLQSALMRKNRTHILSMSLQNRY